MADRRLATAYNLRGNVRVATVFLGVDYHFSSSLVSRVPLLFETRVFGGPLDHAKDRYTTRADALAGHAAILARVNVLTRPWPL